MVTEQQKKYINLCIKASFGNMLSFLNQVASLTIQDNPFMGHQSVSGKTKGYYQVTPELNSFYTSLVGEEILHSAMIGGHDEVNPYPIDYFSVLAGLSGCYIVDGTTVYCFARQPDCYMISDDEIEAIIKGLIDKLILNKVIRLPGASNGKKTTH